jgi:hypothetical protein
MADAELVAVIALLTVAPVAGLGTVAGTGTGAAAGTAATPGVLDATQVDPDSVVLRVNVAADGTATWAVEYRVRLDDANTTDAFESVREDIEADPSQFTASFADRMGRTVESATNRTGREMALRNVTVTATREQLPQEYGVITYRFAWTGFAAVNGDRLRVGDALAGFFLDAETRMLVSWPDGYAATSVTPPPDEKRTRTVVWGGPLEFGPGEPRVVLAPESAVTTTAAGSDGGDGSQGGAGLIPLLLVAVSVVIVAVAGVGYVTLQRSGKTGDGDGDGASASDGDGDGASAGDGDGDGASASDGDGGGTAPSADLLSNEEQVLRLLEENGGRMKQQAVAEELDWTDAKTSQVIGGLREDDAVETFRIGRENVVTLPDEDLT